jgi:predicted dehydrogenase
MNGSAGSQRVGVPSLRIAIAGCGRMGRLHGERILADGRGRVVALFDIDAASALALKDGLAADAVICPRFEDLVSLPEVDAVLVCTPTQLHFEQASAFLERKIPVLCEKPLARTRSEILELIAASRRSWTLLSVAYQRRRWATYRALRQLVGSGQFGAVRAVLSHNIENWQQTIGGTWRDDPAKTPGGFIGDAGSHKIDIAFFVTDLAPTSVFARCANWGSHVETSGSVSALLAGTVPLTMDFVGHAQHFSEILAIHCERGDLTLREGEIWIGQNGRAERYALSERDCNPVVAFLNSLLDRSENFAPPECALPVYDFTQGIFESARTGRDVRLSEGMKDEG